MFQIKINLLQLPSLAHYDDYNVTQKEAVLFHLESRGLDQKFYWFNISELCLYFIVFVLPLRCII